MFMAYMGYCMLCNHLKALTAYWELYSYFLNHTLESHRGQPDRFTIVRITLQDYRDYLEHRENPNFWRAWNNKAKVKPESIPLFV